MTHPRTDIFVDFAHGEVLIQAGANQYTAKTVVGITDNGEYVFYDVVDMKPTTFNTKEELSTTAAGKDTLSDIQESSSVESITDDSKTVKEKLSVKGARELQKQIDRLTRQNQRLKEQMQLTDIPKANRQAVEKQAGELHSAYSSGISKTELANRLEKLYEGMAAKSSSTWNLETMTAPSWEEIRAEARSIADDILAFIPIKNRQRTLTLSALGDTIPPSKWL